MPRTSQIFPKWQFPHVETYMNDYTKISEPQYPVDVDNTITQCYAITSPKGPDNVWIKKGSRTAAVQTFGESNFAAHGQPFMQALNVLNQDNTSCWLMRVMPEDATYANTVVSAYYKADTKDAVPDAHKRKFRVKFVAKTIEALKEKKQILTNLNKADGAETTVDDVKAYRDAEGFTQAPILAANYVGRGVCGNKYSLRMSPNATYEEEYGIKMYNFDCLTTDGVLTTDAAYIAAMTSSPKYASDGSVLIDDILSDKAIDSKPIEITTSEVGIERIYNAYVKFLKELNVNVMKEYTTKFDTYAIPAEQMAGTVPVAQEHLAHYNELKEIALVADMTRVAPDLDEFDFISGLALRSSSDSLPGFKLVKKLTPDVNKTDPSYVAADYTETPGVFSFADLYGAKLNGGTDGAFANADADAKREAVNKAYIKAYDGTYDSRILSANRTRCHAIFDANYDFEVKQTIVNLADIRQDCRVYLDTNIVDSINIATVNELIKKYRVIDNHLVSIDIHNYDIKDPTTGKKIPVTITYFLSQLFNNHFNYVGYHIPMVYDRCQLTGHVRDSIRPHIEEYHTDVKELLYKNRFNYFECVNENIFQRATQNTAQRTDTDLLEENNSNIYFIIKRRLEAAARSQIYNWADESVRNSFIQLTKASFSDVIGSIVENFDLVFKTSAYEFEHSILHLYAGITFRGLNKIVIIEIDLNKRQQGTAASN